ncbi:MAG TPA: hypothetical protein ENJ41_02230 [Oceanospirillales bacterium]|nr:hypothetical protein [Oceanospirillales bacterium]
MKVYKIAVIILVTLMASYYGISQSYGNIGGMGQNACYHNNVYYQIAAGATSLTCPDPHNHDKVSPPHTRVEDPECIIEVRPIL